MTKELKSDTLNIMIEPSLKKFLQDVSDEKGVSLGEYSRFVLKCGLNEIHQRNLKVRELGKQFNVR